MKKQSPLEAIRQRWWIIVIFALLGAALGWAPQPKAVEEQATSFSATHTLLTNGGGDASIVSPNQIVLLATVGEVPKRVVERIGYAGNPAELATQVAVAFDFDTGALTFTSTQATPDQAELIANTFAEELSAYIVERQDTVSQDRVNASRERLQSLEDNLNELTAQLATDPANVVLLAERDAISREYSSAFEQNRQIEDDATQLVFTTLEVGQAVPQIDRGLSAPTSRSTRALMGLVVGAALGTALALLLGRLDRKVRSREQAEDLVAMRARVSIPRVRHTEGGIVVTAGRHDPLSDAYRTVRNVVGFVQGDLQHEPRAHFTLVVSPGPGDGKTSLAANLAAAFLETGQRTIAVNTDFRRPRLYEAIMGTPSPELPYEIDELDDLPRRALPLETTAADMKILDLHTVPGSPGQLVRATTRQINRLAELADQIVIDTSPVGATAEVLELVPLADVIVLVLRVGHTSIEATERTIAILRDLTTAPIVFVIGGIKSERSNYNEYTDRATSHSSRHKVKAPEDRPLQAAE